MAKLLIVEDDMATADVLREVFEAKGFDAEVAGDGFAALAKLKKGGFGAVLLDIMLPGKTGVEVLQEMEKDPKLRKIPVVGLTAVDAVVGVDKELKAVRRGITVLHKPASNKDMLDAVRKAMRG